MNNDHRDALFNMLFLFTLGVATFLRMYRLNEGLWFDEVLTAVRYVRLPFNELIFAFDSENQHFFYSILAHLSIVLFGESEWALRLPAVIFGVGALWLVSRFGCEVTNRLEALLTVGLLCVSYFHIWFSQNARGYTGLQFWTMASALLLLRCLASNDRKKWMLYGVTLALGMYTQLTMLFVPAGHFVIYLWKVRREIKVRPWDGLLYGFCLGGLLTLLLYSPVLGKMFLTMGEESTVAMWKQPLWTLLEIVRGMKLHFAGGIVALVALLIFGAGLFSYSRTKPIVVQLLILPVLIGSVITLALGHPLWPRFFFFNFGLAMLVLVRGTMSLGALLVPEKYGRFPGTAICILLILLSALALPRAYGPKQDFLGARIFVEKNKSPRDVIATAGRIRLVYHGYHRLPYEKVETPESLRALQSDGSQLWVLYIFPEDARTLYPEMMKALEKDFDLIKTFDGSLNGGTVYVRRNRQDAKAPR
ncbi:glycosyltransferase family 39 protein [bacterium]|nr:glycosyltransferase family 39 protein [bacterium]